MLLCLLVERLALSKQNEAKLKLKVGRSAAEIWEIWRVWKSWKFPNLRNWAMRAHLSCRASLARNPSGHTRSCVSTSKRLAMEPRKIGGSLKSSEEVLVLRLLSAFWALS